MRCEVGEGKKGEGGGGGGGERGGTGRGAPAALAAAAGRPRHRPHAGGGDAGDALDGGRCAELRVGQRCALSLRRRGGGKGSREKRDPGRDGRRESRPRWGVAWVGDSGGDGSWSRQRKGCSWTTTRRGVDGVSTPTCRECPSTHETATTDAAYRHVVAELKAVGTANSYWQGRGGVLVVVGDSGGERGVRARCQVGLVRGRKFL